MEGFQDRLARQGVTSFALSSHNYELYIQTLRNVERFIAGIKTLIDKRLEAVDGESAVAYHLRQFKQNSQQKAFFAQ